MDWNKLKYLIPPILLIILLFPIELGAIGYLPDFLRGKFSSFSVSFALPIYMGLLSFSAYFYVVVYEVKKKNVNGLTRWWIRISLILAMIACVYGSIKGYMLLLLILPLAVPSFIICALLLYRFEKNI